jgi:predicted metal-binding protein
MGKVLDYKKFVKKAVELGALDAKIIDANTIVTAAWVRMKCKFGCGGYGTNNCCPPNTPTPEEMRDVIDCYKKAILVHKKKLGTITKIIVELEREIFLCGYYKAFGLGAGGCTLCKSCPKHGCKKHDQTRPSLESCGIDVYATVRANGFPIEVVRDRKSDQNYYGVVLID